MFFLFLKGGLAASNIGVRKSPVRNTAICCESKLLTTIPDPRSLGQSRSAHKFSSFAMRFFENLHVGEGER